LGDQTHYRQNKETAHLPLPPTFLGLPTFSVDSITQLQSRMEER